MYLAKYIMVVENTAAYTWDWYWHLVGDRASFANDPKIEGSNRALGTDSVVACCVCLFKLVCLAKPEGTSLPQNLSISRK
jgi:hypothetical protein